MSRSWTPLINLISNSLPADRWLIIYNLVLVNIVLFHVVWRYCVLETDSLFVNDTKFPTAVELTLDAYEFMELQRIGRAPVKSLNVGPIEPEITTCWTSPKLPDDSAIIKSAPDWQTLKSQTNELHLYNAYIDRRPNQYLSPDVHAFVQVIGVVRRELRGTVFCVLYDEDGQYVGSTPAVVRPIWQRAWDPRTRFYLPLLLTCPLPNDITVPKHVSIVSQPCERYPSNALIIRDSYSKEKKGNKEKVVVCVKGMDFLEDTSGRLVEWLEFQRLVGVDKVVMYTYGVHWKARAVFEHYVKDGLLDLVPISLPGNQPNGNDYTRSRFIWRNRQQKRRNELIPYNDCLYRHLGTHDWALILDTDEIVVPMGHDNYTYMLRDIMDTLRKGDSDVRNLITTLSTINVFKFDNSTKEFNPRVPQEMHMLRHRIRSKMASKPGDYGKSFLNIATVATAFNHFALHKIRPNVYPTKYVAPTTALKLHYKSKCPIESRDICPKLYTELKEDNSLDKFAQLLINATKTALKTIG